jgi:hypothetical protein
VTQRIGQSLLRDAVGGQFMIGMAARGFDTQIKLNRGRAGSFVLLDQRLQACSQPEVFEYMRVQGA